MVFIRKRPTVQKVHIFIRKPAHSCLIKVLILTVDTSPSHLWILLSPSINDLAKGTAR